MVQETKTSFVTKKQNIIFFPFKTSFFGWVIDVNPIVLLILFLLGFGRSMYILYGIYTVFIRYLYTLWSIMKYQLLTPKYMMTMSLFQYRDIVRLAQLITLHHPSPSKTGFEVEEIRNLRKAIHLNVGTTWIRAIESTTSGFFSPPRYWTALRGRCGGWRFNATKPGRKPCWTPPPYTLNSSPAHFSSL